MLQVLMVALDFQVLDCVDNLIAHLVGNCIRTREREKKRSSYKFGVMILITKSNVNLRGICHRRVTNRMVWAQHV